MMLDPTAKPPGLAAVYSTFCPFCNARPGQFCRTRRGYRSRPHLRRRHWALVQELRARRRT